ncbi:MAG TPA: precorrin-8X methylmutase [Dissulfurispiraceae bacterium]|nr:precorrin-8X methylmutase [Dissulfurispiraceae bacterium]
MDESIILIGHGSPQKDANNLEFIAAMLHGLIHAGCSDDCVTDSYLQFTKPAIMETIEGRVKSGAKRIILHPFFLNAGLHVTKDIPELIEKARELFPGVEFVYTEPLGLHEKLAQIVMERISAATGSGSRLAPEEIEKKSFEILSREQDFSTVPDEQLPIIQRVIHATADFEFKKTLVFHPKAVATGLRAIKEGKNILTDVEMVKTGINKRSLEKWGGKVICAIADEEVGRASKETGRTRAEVAIEKRIGENVGIIAIGNAPTALLKVIDILSSPVHPFTRSPILVIGVPVGFVKAFESKAILAGQEFPFITNLSRKGGTPVAVAIANALLKMASEVKSKK